MKVTIDTKEDSYDDIAKVLHLLTNILERKGTAVGETGEPADTTHLMSMFSSPSSAERKEVPGKASDFSSFLNLASKAKEVKKEEEVRIEYF